MLWKIPEKVFHSVEKSAKSFPYCGKFAKKFSIPWKTRPPAPGPAPARHISLAKLRGTRESAFGAFGDP
jgi:hypothetical protein